MIDGLSPSLIHSRQRRGNGPTARYGIATWSNDSTAPSDPDPDCRRLALQLARECAALELSDDLVAIVTDTGASSQDRVAAGWMLSRLEDPNRTESLRPLALDEGLRGDDPEDDIKGVALLASWPHALTNAEVFAILTCRKRHHYHGV